MILVIVALSDVHWGVMKTVIWVQMTREAVSASEPVWESIRSTVSGELKCHRCHKLDKEKSDSRELDHRFQWEAKTTLACENRCLILLFPPVELRCIELTRFSSPVSRSDEPLPFPPWC